MNDYVRDCKALRMAQESYDLELPGDDEALHLEIERVASELFLEGESWCCGQTLTLEQAVLMATQDGQLLENLQSICLDDTEVSHGMEAAEQINNAIECMVKGVIRDAE